MGADAAHVVGHQSIPALGHDRHLVMRPFRRGADPHETDAHRVGDRTNLVKVGLQLGPDLQRRYQGCARKLKLPAGFQAYIRAVTGQADHVVALTDRIPTVAGGETVEDGRDGAGTGIGKWLTGVGQPAELFMLCPDPPISLRLAAGLHVGGELVKAFDRAAAGLGYRHEGWLRGWQGGVGPCGPGAKRCLGARMKSRGASVTTVVKLDKSIEIIGLLISVYLVLNSASRLEIHGSGPGKP